ncbi:MAG: hypothetical protein ACK50J_27660, partial [Planctomyces sp.]
LPVEWAGLLDGVNDGVGYITATSTLVQPGGSLTQLLSSVPASISITNMSDLLKFSGLSLDTILGALEDVADDLVGKDQQVIGKLVGGSVDPVSGEFSGGQLKVYGEVWQEGSVIATGYTAVVTSGVQNSQLVEDLSGNKVRLLEWQQNGLSVWGQEVAVDANDNDLQTWSIARYRLLATYDADDVAINRLQASARTGVTLTDESGSQTLGLFRVQDGSLYDKIPMLGVSLADMLGDGAVSFAAGFSNAISKVRNAARNIAELETQLNAELRTFFGLGANVNLVTLKYENSAFDFDLDFEALFNRTYDLKLDIDELNLQQWLGFDPGQFLDVSLTAPVTVQAGVNLHLGFGFDLSNVFAPIFYVDAASGITASASGVADDIDAKLSIDVPALGPIDLPPIGLTIRDGSAAIRAGFYANLGDPAADPDGDGRVEPGSISVAFQAELYGSATADLPMFFPLESLPLGGTTADKDGNDVPDNVLHAHASFSVDETFQLQTEYDYALPRISMSFDAVQAFLAYIDNAGNMLSGLEGFFDGIDQVAAGIDSINLPIIGGSSFDSLAAEIRNLRTSVLGTRSSGVYQNGLGQWLQSQGNNSVVDSVLDEIRHALFDGFKALNDSTGATTNGITGSLFGFVVADLDETGARQYDSSGKLKVKVPTSFRDIELVFTPTGLLTFNLKFGGTLVDGELPIDFSGGIPGVSLDIDAKLQAHIDYLMGIGLGIGNLSTTAIPKLGIFVDTSGINEQGEELALDVSARLTTGSTAVGTLGFLKMKFEDVNPNGGSGLTGHFGLDIRDADNNQRWELREGVSLTLTANAFAQADFFAQVETVAGKYLPSVKTTIRYSQMLGEAVLSTDGRASINFGNPQVILENVTLNVGSMFKSVLGQTLSSIHDIVEPLKPVVDLLLLEIPMGGIANPPIRVIDIARLRLPAKTVDTMTKVLQVIKSTIEFLETIDALSSAGDINFGTFNLTESTLKNKNAELSNADVAGAQKDTSQLNGTSGTNVANALKGPDQKGLDNEQSTKSAATKGKKRQSGKNFSIPLLDDPMSLLDFIMGRGDVDLFWYDLPDLKLDFEYRRSFPIFPGLNAGFFGKISAFTNFDFGFDTRGLRQWMDKDFDPAES